MMWAVLLDWLNELGPCPASPGHVRAQLEAEYGVQLGEEPLGTLELVRRRTEMPAKDSEEFVYLMRAMGRHGAAMRSDANDGR